MSYSDHDIVGRLHAGDQSSLRYLFEEYYKELVIHAMKFVINQGVAEEIVQDVFIRLWENRVSFRLQKSFRSYLFTAVKNRSLNFLKSRYGRIRFEELDQNSQIPFSESADRDLNLAELQEEVRSAVHSLPPKCRTIFNLSRNSGLTTREIAGQLGLSVKTVQAQISIALKKIKAHLNF